MAARKKKTSRAVAKQSMAVATVPDLGDDYADILNRDRATAKASGWGFISTKGSGWRHGDDPLPNPLQVIIVGAVRMNQHYAGAYDPNAFSPPDCYAIADGVKEEDMAPPASLATKRNEDCASCPQNAFGSGDGRGKACKNQIRVALLSYEGEQDYEKSKGLIVTVPPASIKDFSAYNEKVTSEEGLDRALFTVATTLEKDDSGVGSKIIAGFHEEIQHVPTLKTLLPRVQEGYKNLLQPPATSSSESDSPSGRGKRRVARQTRGS